MNLLNLQNNIKNVNNRIKIAMERSNRCDEVQIIGASKTMSQSIIDMVSEHNLLENLGENRVQELCDKYREGQSFNWHFIGALQSNKVRDVIGKVKLIHSVDRDSLAEEINRLSIKNNLISNVLIQVNMGEEESKRGYFPSEIGEAIKRLQIYKNINIQGLMAVMPIAEDSVIIELYKRLGTIFTLLKQEYGYSTLSAGMSNDYELAIEHAGATLVRIGRAIFGER